MDEFFGTLFGSTVVSQQLAYLEASLLKDIWETFYSTVLSTFFAYVIGLPLGIILVTGEPDGYDREELGRVREDIITLAQAEGLTAHANSIQVRFEGD